MRQIGTVFFLSLAAAVVTQALALTAQAPWMTLPGLFVGLIWALDFWRGKHWSGTFSFVVLMILTFSGFWMRLSSLLLLASAVLSLVTWDLDAFAQKLKAYDPDQGMTPVIRTHLSRLSGIAIAGYFLSLLPLLVKTRLNLPVALILGLILILTLSQAIHFLRDR